MKSRILNLGLVLTSLLGYLEWGGGNGAFLFQMEFDILTKLFNDPFSVLHPFTLLPMIGQILLAVNVLRKNQSRILTFVGLGGTGILLLFMFVIGLISLNYKITLSTLPFILTGVFTIRYYRKMG